MEQFAEQLARISELSDDELAVLDADLVTAFDAADDASDIETMQEIAEALDQVRGEVAKRSSGDPAAEEEGEPVAASAEVDAGNEAQTEETEETAVESADASDTDSAAEGDNIETESEGQVPVEITSEAADQSAGVVVASAAPITITAGGDIPGVTAGTELASMDDVVDAMTRKINAMKNVTGNGEQIIVASLQHPDADEDHTLRAGDLEGNARKMREFLSNRDALTPEGLVAGAWCAPRVPIYEVPTVGTTERPVRDGLATFRADRGGVTWMQPPTIANAAIGSSIWKYNGSQWQAYTDPEGKVLASPADEKPIADIVCGAEQSVDVEAVPFALRFSNMMAKAFPEWVRASTELAMVAQARFAEQRTLSQLFSLAVTGTAGTVQTSLGVARDFFRAVAIAAANKRHEQRMSPTSPLQLLAPQWLAVAIAVDLGLGQDFAVHGFGEVDGHFRELNIQPIWYIDDVPGKASFSSESAFPNIAHWLLFPTGTYVRLDAGELNLGVVRTGDDIRKNTYTEFAETFETVAHFGPAGYEWTVYGQTAVAIKGAYSAPVTVS